MSGIILVYVTFGSEGEAKNIAETLLNQKLIACANIQQPHMALYEWEGRVESGAEIAAFLKTTDDKFGDVKAEILKHHSYDCPCIVALPVSDGHKPFLDWVEDQLGNMVPQF